VNSVEDRWPATTPAGWPAPPVEVAHWRYFGWSSLQAKADGPDRENRDVFSISQSAAGWPALALARQSALERDMWAARQSHARPGVKLPFRIRRREVELYAMPLFPGFALDSAFYAAIASPSGPRPERSAAASAAPAAAAPPAGTTSEAARAPSAPSAALLRSGRELQRGPKRSPLRQRTSDEQRPPRSPERSVRFVHPAGVRRRERGEGGEGGEGGRLPGVQGHPWQPSPIPPGWRPGGWLGRRGVFRRPPLSTAPPARARSSGRSWRRSAGCGW
jgi:hypothetical protein